MSDSCATMNCRASAISQVCEIDKQLLRRYRRLELLQPRAICPDGQRAYSRNDLIRLERLSFLQMIGLSRAEIHDCLLQEIDLAAELRLQRDIVIEKRRRLNHLIHWIEYAEQVNRDPDSGDWCYLGSVVGSIRNSNDFRDFKQLYVQRKHSSLSR